MATGTESDNTEMGWLGGLDAGVAGMRLGESVRSEDRDCDSLYFCHLACEAPFALTFGDKFGS
jgi:hypothetical protein